MNREKKQTKEEKKKLRLYERKQKNKRKIRSFTTGIKNQNMLNRLNFDRKKTTTKTVPGYKKIPYACVIVKCVSFTHIPLRQKKKKGEEMFRIKTEKKIKCARSGQ